MKEKLVESITLPEGMACEVSGKTITCRKDSQSIVRIIDVPTITAKLKGSNLIFEAESSNKNDRKVVMSYMAHMRNIIEGFNNKFVYKLQACSVHFPMTLKVEGRKLLVNNFLGEKKPRIADIIEDVEISIKGQEITLSSHNKEYAGQTAANIEKITKVRNRDRRIFQDGIYITEKPGRSV